MKINSIIFKMMVPLVVMTIGVIVATLLLTQVYLKKVIEDIFLELKVNHFEKVYSLKMENILSNIKNNGVVIADSIEVQKFILSPEAAEGKISDEMKHKLFDLKTLYKLENIYVVDAKSKNYFNEKGFVRAIDTASNESAWYLKTLESKEKIIVNADSDITGALHLWSDVVVGDVHNPLGLAGCGMNISSIYEVALDDFKQDSAEVLILDDSNTILGSSSTHIAANKFLHDSSLPKEKIAAIEEAKKSHSELVKYSANYEERYLLLVRINELDFTIIIDFSKEKFLHSVHGVYDRIIMGGVVLLLLLLLGGGWAFTYLISRPLKNISLAVSEFDYASDFKPKGCENMGYEVDMICDAFNTSSAILRKTVDQHKNNEELLRSIINSADDLIFYKDTKGKYLGCNTAYEKWNLKTLDEIVGKTDRDLHPAAVAHDHIRTDRQVIAQNKTIVVEEKFQKKDGSFVLLQVKKGPFYNKEGKILGVVVIARDLTLLKNMEHDLRTLNATLESRVEEKTQELQTSKEMLEEHIYDLEKVNAKLRKAKESALQAAQAKSNFISGISHELRTPLNAIINFTDQTIEDFDEMLVDKALQTDTKGFLQRVLVNSRHLLQLINDLLEFTKAEAGKVDYKLEANNINSILSMAYNNTHSLLNGTSIKFNLTLSHEPLLSLVDSRRFLQVVLNLLSNAIKFTKQGSIELKSFVENDLIIVELKDTGKGIPQEKHEIIFEPFMQVNNTDNGTGLGLGLAKRMCDDMGITISFTSVEESGTTFRLVLKKFKNEEANI